jgi:hypothetical protein
MLAVAQLIAGSSLFIGNQSSSNACAEGLKHPLIQETSLTYPDCVYVRPGAQHVAEGRVVLADGTVLATPPPAADRNNRKLMQSPPGLWQYPGCAPAAAFGVIARMVAQLEQVPLVEAEDRLYEANVNRCPKFFQDASEVLKLSRVRAALGVA